MLRMAARTAGSRAPCAFTKPTSTYARSGSNIGSAGSGGWIAAGEGLAGGPADAARAGGALWTGSGTRARETLAAGGAIAAGVGFGAGGGSVVRPWVAVACGPENGEGSARAESTLVDGATGGAAAVAPAGAVVFAEGVACGGRRCERANS